jgi:hypothetical protein
MGPGKSIDNAVAGKDEGLELNNGIERERLSSKERLALPFRCNGRDGARERG